MDKATRAQVKQHNRRLVMRAIYQKEADNRAALARVTSLTKPTIGTIMSELIDAGYVVETGYGQTRRRGGKRPMLVKFNTRARQVIGITVTRGEIIGGIAYLDGDVVARHQTPIPDNADVLEMLKQTVNALVIQHDAPLLGIVIGVSGIVDQASGVVMQSSELDWQNIALAEHMQAAFDMPCYVSNNTELVTRLHATSDAKRNRSMVTVSVGSSLEIGSTSGGNMYQHGASISDLQLPDRPLTLSALHRQQVQQAMESIVADNPDGILATYGTTYYALRHALQHENPRAEQLVDELSACLAYLYRWIYSVMRPSEIVLVGTITHLGDRLYTRLRQHLNHYAGELDLSHLLLTMDATPYLSMKGAIVYGIQEETGIL